MTTKRTSRAVTGLRGDLTPIKNMVANQGASIAESLRGRYENGNRAGELPDFLGTANFLMAELETGLNQLVDLDQERHEEARDHIQARDDMNEKLQKLRDRMQFVRTNIRTGYGEAALIYAPYDATEAQNFEGLVDQVEYMIQRLPSLADLPPSPTEGDSTVGLVSPPELLISSLESRLGAARSARDHYWQQLQGRRSAESRQREVVNQLRSDIGHVREILKRLCLLAGRSDLAELLKARRRTGRGGTLDPNDPLTDSANDPADPPTTAEVA